MLSSKTFSYFKIGAVLLLLATSPKFLSGQSGGCYGFGTSSTEEAHDVIETSNGNILVAGETNQNSGDAYLMKFTHNGQSVQWDQTYGTGNKDVAKGVVEHNGDYFFVGYTKSPGNKDVFIVQVDTSNGNVKNHKVLGGSNTDVGNDIIVTNGGNLAIAGHTKTTTGANSVLTFVIEFSMTSTSFSINQQFAYGTGSTNDGNALEQDSDNDFWVVGDDKNNNGSGLIYKLKENFTNNTQSDIIYEALVTENNNKQILNDIEEDGDYVVTAGTGKFTNSVEKNSSIGAKAAFAIKLDHTYQNNPSNADAPVSQMKEFGTGNTDKANSLSVSSDDYTFTGINNNNNKMLSFKIKTDFSSVSWNQVMGGGSTDFGNSIIELSHGDYLSVGKSASSDYNNGSGNFFLAKLTNSGSNCCGNNTSNTFQDVNLDQPGTLTNSPSNSTFSVDELKLKSRQSTLSSPTTSANSGTFENNSGCGALPVEFMGFNLSKKPGQQIQVNWQTASETNNDFFTILRSQDGKAFTPVGQKEGQGTVTSSTHYTYRDKVPTSGTYYYKIRQTDYDRTTSCSPVKAITIAERNNPATITRIQRNGNHLAVTVEAIESPDLIVQVVNSQGHSLGKKPIGNTEGRQTIRYSLLQEAPQFYFVRVINAKTGEKKAGEKVIPLR